MGGFLSVVSKLASQFSRSSGVHTTREEEKMLEEMLNILTSEEMYQYASSWVKTHDSQNIQLNQKDVDMLQKWIPLFQSFVSSLQHKTSGDITHGPVPRAPVKVFLIVTAQTYGADQQILDQLKKQGSTVTATHDLLQCDVILLFCPFLSRIGSDIDAAVRQIPADDKPVVLILMHHTFNPDQYLDKTRWSERYPRIKQEVRVLFHQSHKGLLNCPRNKESVRTLKSICDQY